MAATQSGFTPINQPSPGSMATGSGAGGSGGGGKKPNRAEVTPSHYFDLAWLKTLLIKLRLDSVTLKQIRAACKASDIKNVPAQFKSSDSRRFIESNDSRLRTEYEPTTRKSDHVFNLGPSSNTNYVSGALVQSANGRTLHIGGNACERCQRGSGPFQECVTLTVDGHKFMKGACANCGVGNHYESCSFSDHQPLPRASSQQEPSGPRRMGSSAISSSPPRATQSGSSQHQSYMKVPIPSGINQNTPEGAVAVMNAANQAAMNAARRLAAGGGMGSGRYSTTSGEGGYASAQSQQGSGGGSQRSAGSGGRSGGGSTSGRQQQQQPPSGGSSGQGYSGKGKGRAQ